MKLFTLLALIAFSLISDLQAKNFTASNAKSESLSISYDEYTGIVEVNLTNQTGTKNQPLFLTGIKASEDLETAILNLLQSDPYIGFADSIKAQLEAFLAGRCEVDLDRLSDVIEKDLLEKQLTKINLRSEEKGLYETKHDPIVLKDELVNYEFTTYGKPGELSRIRLFSSEKLILNQPLVVGQNNIRLVLKNKHLQPATIIEANIDSHIGGLIKVTSLVYDQNGKEKGQLHKQVLLKKSPNGLFEFDISSAPIAPFQNPLFSSSPGVSGSRNGGVVEQKKPRLFAKKFEQKIYQTIIKEANQEPMIAEYLGRARTSQIANEVAQRFKLEKNILRKQEMIEGYAYKKYVRALTEEFLRKYLPEGLKNQNTFLASQVVTNFNACIDNSLTFSQKNKIKQGLSSCKDKFMKSGPVLIGEILLEKQLNNTLFSYLKNKTFAKKMTEKAKGSFRQCIKTRFLKQPSVDAIKYVQGCIYQSIILQVNEGGREYMSSALAGLIGDENERGKVSNVILHEVYSCLQDARYLNKKNEINFSILLNVEIDQFERHLMGCYEKITARKSGALISRILNHHIGLNKILADFPNLAKKRDQIAINQGYKNCSSYVGDNNPVYCIDYIESKVESEFGKLIFKDSLKSFGKDLTKEDIKKLSSYEDPLTGCIDKNEGQLLRLLKIKSKIPVNMSEAQYWNQHRHNLFQQGFNWSLDSDSIEIPEYKKKNYSCFKTALETVVPLVAGKILGDQLDSSMGAMSKSLTQKWRDENLIKPVNQCFMNYLDKFTDLQEMAGYFEHIQKDCLRQTYRTAPSVVVAETAFNVIEDIASDKHADKLKKAVGDKFSKDKILRLFSKVNEESELTPILTKLQDDLTLTIVHEFQKILLAEQIDDKEDAAWVFDRISKRFPDKVILEKLGSVDESEVTKLKDEMQDFGFNIYLERLVEMNITSEKDRKVILKKLKNKYTTATMAEYQKQNKSLKDELAFDLIHAAIGSEVSKLVADKKSKIRILEEIKTKFDKKYISDYLSTNTEEYAHLEEDRLHLLEAEITHEAFELIFDDVLSKFYEGDKRKLKMAWLEINRLFSKKERLKKLNSVKPGDKSNEAIEYLKIKTITIIFHHEAQKSVHDYMKTLDSERSAMKHIREKYNLKFFQNRLKGIEDGEKLIKSLNDLKFDVIKSVLKNKFSNFFKK